MAPWKEAHVNIAKAGSQNFEDAVMVPVEPESASVFVPVQSAKTFTGDSLYLRARKDAVLAHAENKREQGSSYSPYGVVDSDGCLLPDSASVEDVLGVDVERDSWMLPLAYVHGGLPVSARSVSAGSAFNEQGVWERSSLARVVQHVPSPVLSVSGGEVLEMPSGVMARRILAFIASRVLETGSTEFVVPSQPRALARLAGVPALSAEGYRHFADTFRMCLGLRSAVFERAQEGGRAELLHAFSVAADVEDSSMGIMYSLEGNDSGFMVVHVSDEFFDYVNSGNVVAVPAGMWGSKLVRSSAVALDVLALVLARAASLRSGNTKTSKVWIAWSHLARQFAVFSSSVHKMRSVYRNAVNAVRSLLTSEGAEDVVSLVGGKGRKGFAGFMIQAYRSGVKAVRPHKVKKGDTLSKAVRSAVSRETLNESAAKDEQVLIPIRAPRKGNIYRAVDLALLSTKISGAVGVYLPAISEDWERIVDTIIDRYAASARNGNMKKVNSWQAYVEASIKNQPSIMDTPRETPVTVRPARAIQEPAVQNGTSNQGKPVSEPHVATDGLPRLNSEATPKTEPAKRKDSNFGAPSTVYMSEALLRNPAVANFDLLDEDFLKKYMDEDYIITLNADTPEHYAYSDALQAGTIPVNNYDEWKKGVKFPPVRIQLPSGGYMYPNEGSRYTKGDDYYCRVLYTEDFGKDIKRTIAETRATRPAKPKSAADISVSVPEPQHVRHIKVVKEPVTHEPARPVVNPAPETTVSDTAPHQDTTTRPAKREICTNMPKNVAATLAPWDRADAHYKYVDAEETLDGYLANFNADPVESEVIDESSLPPVSNDEEAEARAAILKWVNGAKDRKPVLDGIMNPKPEPTDEYPIMYY
jgi:hypothetical protein